VRPRNRHASLSCSSRTAGRFDPTVGGTDIIIGPSTSASPPIHASQRSMASASLVENFANSAWFFTASPSYCTMQRPSGKGRK
jgi:hypothetical protein